MDWRECRYLFVDMVGRAGKVGLGILMNGEGGGRGKGGEKMERQRSVGRDGRL